MEKKQIGSISNYYGGLYIMKNDKKYYWLIENYSTDFDSLSDWVEIDKELYDALNSYDLRNPNPFYHS